MEWLNFIKTVHCQSIFVFFSSETLYVGSSFLEWAVSQMNKWIRSSYADEIQKIRIPLTWNEYILSRRWDDKMNGNWHATRSKPLQVTVQIVWRSQLNVLRYGGSSWALCAFKWTCAEIAFKEAIKQNTKHPIYVVVLSLLFCVLARSNCEWSKKNAEDELVDKR